MTFSMSYPEGSGSGNVLLYKPKRCSAFLVSSSRNFSTSTESIGVSNRIGIWSTTDNNRGRRLKSSEMIFEFSGVVGVVGIAEDCRQAPLFPEARNWSRRDAGKVFATV